MIDTFEGYSWPLIFFNSFNLGLLSIFSILNSGYVFLAKKKNSTRMMDASCPGAHSASVLCRVVSFGDIAWWPGDGGVGHLVP